MKIEVVKYNGFNDFKIKIDGVVFTNTTTRGNFISYGAMSQYIIKTKYNILYFVRGNYYSKHN